MGPGPGGPGPGGPGRRRGAGEPGRAAGGQLRRAPDRPRGPTSDQAQALDLRGPGRGGGGGPGGGGRDRGTARAPHGAQRPAGQPRHYALPGRVALHDRGGRQGPEDLQHARGLLRGGEGGADGLEQHGADDRPPHRRLRHPAQPAHRGGQRAGLRHQHRHVPRPRLPALRADLRGHHQQGHQGLLPGRGRAGLVRGRHGQPERQGPAPDPHPGHRQPGLRRLPPPDLLPAGRRGLRHPEQH